MNVVGIHPSQRYLPAGGSTLSAPLSAVDNNEKFKPMKSEFNRQQSFINWPHHSFLSPADLAREGFFYTQKQDIVKCAFCGLELGKWEYGDVPSNDHRAWSSACPIVCQLPCGNIQMSEQQQQNGHSNNNGGNSSDASSPQSHDTCGKYGIHVRQHSGPENGKTYDVDQFAIKTTNLYPQFATNDARLQTFADWPVSIRQRPVDLAEAGFYYSGKSDQTICFSCGGGLKAWEEQDDPWEQHASWFPKCNYLRLHKTPDYIERFHKSVDDDERVKLAGSVPNAASTTSSSAVGVAASPVPSLNATASTTSTTTTPPTTTTTTTSTESSTGDADDPTKDSQAVNMCKICFMKEIGVVFLPCGHMIACVDCAPALTKCAVCRRELEATVRAFLS